MNMQIEILDLFNVMVIDDAQKSAGTNTNYVQNGIVLDFTPTGDQLVALTTRYKPIDMTTLFGKQERLTAPIDELLLKQVLHYIEVYGLATPGAFGLEVTTGHVAHIAYVKGVTFAEFTDMMQKLLYSNAPMKNGQTVHQIINELNIKFNINKVANNELRVALFDVGIDTFDNGDDAVRYMCFVASSGDPMLIKSKNLIDQMKAIQLPIQFFERHELQLSQVFNRHKKLIIAAKNKTNATAVNRISRMSKKTHVPIIEHVSKRFVSTALNDSTYDFSVLNKISMRDKFKYLNLLAFKREQATEDMFMIRNGKLFIKGNRPVYDYDAINRVETAVVNSIKSDLVNVGTILLDPKVDYGLPISRKQTVGQLPFGTSIQVDTAQISSGIYWENAWGARDLDLSTIDKDGNRTGWWGAYSGYNNKNPIVYSGDVTDATNGAMEFMTSSDKSYGLFVNVFSGEKPEMELVVGNESTDEWIGDTVIREKYKLNSKENIVGFVRNTKFIVYQGRVSNKRVSGNTGTEVVVKRGLSDFWTLQKLFDTIGVKYETIATADKIYDHNLTYNGFSYDKLENLLL